MKFTVKYGNETRTIDGPDDATQEQAQQIADTHRDMSGDTGRAGILGTGVLGGDFGAKVGRLTSSFAQGGAELAGGPAQLAGATPGPNYQAAEAEPRNFGENVAKFAGATLPLAGAGAIEKGLVRGGEAVVDGDPAVARFLASKGLTPPASAWGKLVTTPSFPKTAAAIPMGVGAVSGAAAPADSQTQRAINTGIGAGSGGISSMALNTLSALDRLAGLAAGFAAGGGHGWEGVLGGRFGETIGGHVHPVTAIRSWLSQLPPSVRARFITDITSPFTKAIGSSYDEFTGTINNADQGQ